ncbi:hypothetical protein [Geoalkalibacter halelectricus]|uniref:hypothetical protein n=1 Tax=Geoalkalibacter halelectricus TaxID=2847045 RepID=UPI003D1C51E0
MDRNAGSLDEKSVTAPYHNGGRAILQDIINENQGELSTGSAIAAPIPQSKDKNGGGGVYR